LAHEWEGLSATVPVEMPGQEEILALPAYARYHAGLAVKALRCSQGRATRRVAYASL